MTKTLFLTTLIQVLVVCILINTRSRINYFNDFVTQSYTVSDTNLKLNTTKSSENCDRYDAIRTYSLSTLKYGYDFIGYDEQDSNHYNNSFNATINLTYVYTRILFSHDTVVLTDDFYNKMDFVVNYNILLLCVIGLSFILNILINASCYNGINVCSYNINFLLWILLFTYGISLSSIVNLPLIFWFYRDTNLYSNNLYDYQKEMLWMINNERVYIVSGLILGVMNLVKMVLYGMFQINLHHDIDPSKKYFIKKIDDDN